MPNITITINNTANTENTETTEKHVCDHCGQVVDHLREVHTADGIAHWCDECIDNDAVECECCGALYEDADELGTVNTGWNVTEEWCQHCIDNGAYTCDHCDELYSYDYDTPTDVVVRHTYRLGSITERWCPDCVDDDAVTCEDCGEVFSTYSNLYDEYMMYWGEYRTLCDHCRDNYYSRCEDCERLVNDDEVEWVNDEAYCPNCADEHRHGDNISCYHHTGACCFWLDDGTMRYAYDLPVRYRSELYLGAELEVDDLSDKGCAADEIIERWGNDRVECKEDGSLSYRGMEIVSQPMTPRYHLESGMWESIIESVRDQNGLSYDSGTCGLHIHLSRDFFINHDAVYRLDRMFHRFENELVKFSRRRGGDLHWCAIGDDSELAEIEDVEERKQTWENKKLRKGRYEAVNDTNRNTVEIRLWRGTLNVETLRATIEMTTGLAIIANTMSDELAEKLTWKMLCMFVRYALEQQGLPHDDLDRYLVRRGL